MWFSWGSISRLSVFIFISQYFSYLMTEKYFVFKCIWPIFLACVSCGWDVSNIQLPMAPVVSNCWNDWFKIRCFKFTFHFYTDALTNNLHITQRKPERQYKFQLSHLFSILQKWPENKNKLNWDREDELLAVFDEGEKEKLLKFAFIQTRCRETRKIHTERVTVWKLVIWSWYYYYKHFL